MRLLVYDLGGGTFDVTVVEIRPLSFKTLATEGDVRLGGKDWDEKLVQLVAQRLRHQHHIDPYADPHMLQELWIEAEVAKRTLTERPKAPLYFGHASNRVKLEITRKEFEDATAALLSRTRTTTEIVLREAGLTWSGIDRVLLVGGSTRMPMVPSMLKQLSSKQPDCSVSPDEAVAHGAALRAASLVQAGGSKYSVTNVLSHSLGIAAVDRSSGKRRNFILMRKNSGLPLNKRKAFRTAKANQRRLEIQVLQGESDSPDECTRIGTISVTELPANLPAGSPIAVEYRCQTDGRLQVSAELERAGKVTADFVRDKGMSADDLKWWTERINRQFARSDS
jgi:molecular chaperone DnaK